MTKKYQDKKESKKCRDKEWLYQKYVIEKLSTRKIAKLCGCAQTTIFRYLKKYQISCNKNESSTSERCKKTLAKIFIRDYGIDGERLGNGYNPQKIRLMCRECPEFRDCKGKKWKTNLCEPWLQFVEVTGFRRGNK